MSRYTFEEKLNIVSQVKSGKPILHLSLECHIREGMIKELSSNQGILFPTNLFERIPADHPVLLVNQVVVGLNINKLLSDYKGGGCSSYHPRMMLKVLFYAYLCNIYSCRKIARALHENIYFMWLSGDNTPDFRTINRFQGEPLKEHIKELFIQIVLMLNELGYLSLDVQYILLFIYVQFSKSGEL